MREPTDKFTSGMADLYKQLFASCRDKPMRVLEIGIFRGGSLWFWSDLFPHPETRIIGLDIRIPPFELPKNAAALVCDQNDAARLRKIGEDAGPFDLIVDDGSHFTAETRTCFQILFPFVGVAGHYMIEDWAVGYWKDRDPRFVGMVELVTDIISSAPAKQIDAMQIFLHPGRALAVFRKGKEGWRA